MRVLVVDDDEASRYLLVSVLRSRGHEALEAADGREALTVARSQPLDLVVTDILMPVMDGYSLAREWKADPELAKVPLVFYTASYTEPADRRFAESLGADAFILKPQEPDVLVGLIENAAGQGGGGRAVHTPQARSESEVLREYSERLVSKLEQKVVELNTANDGLRRALEVLSDEVQVKKTLIEQLTSELRERGKAQAELTTANELLSTIVSSSPLAIISLDRDLRVSAWNPAAERMLGWSADEVIGHDFPAVSEQQRPELMQLATPLFNGETGSTVVEVRRHRRDGTPVDLRIHASVRHDAGGEVVGTLAIFEDVTEERQVEAVKTAFLSMVSHELRTPLTSIIGYTDLMRQQAQPGDKSADLASGIRGAADRMRLLVDELLGLAQIQAGPLRLDPERLDLGALTAAAVDRLAVTPRHEVVFEAAEGLPHVFGDPARLADVLDRLLENAVKYSPDGGRISVRVTADDGSVRVDITDPGIGIASSDVGHIFDRFSQADMSDARRFGGLGVGLHIARQTVEAHRGRIEVASAPGRGSTFSIVIPAAS